MNARQLLDESNAGKNALSADLERKGQEIALMKDKEVVCLLCVTRSRSYGCHCQKHAHVPSLVCESYMPAQPHVVVNRSPC